MYRGPLKMQYVKTRYQATGVENEVLRFLSVHFGSSSSTNAFSVDSPVFYFIYELVQWLTRFAAARTFTLYIVSTKSKPEPYFSRCDFKRCIQISIKFGIFV